jgi:CheY-like chemotaxis protein
MFMDANGSDGEAEQMPILPEEVGPACRLLLVDADRPVREALSEAFQLHGCEVWAVSDVSEAATVVRLSGFDAGLVDVGRGHPSEWQVVEELRRGGVRHLAAMSVQAGMGEKKEAVGLEEVWEKPLVLDEVLSWLHRAKRSPAGV